MVLLTKIIYYSVESKIEAKAEGSWGTILQAVNHSLSER